jgi:hypothetical protein
VHALPTHATPAAFLTFVLQFVVQLPHWVVLLEVLVSQPVLPAAQWLNPALHPHLHVPAEQLGLPFTVLHALPHCPQLVGVVKGSVQVPAQHAVCAPVQALPHALQLSGSLVVSRHRLLQQLLPPGHVPAEQASTQAPAGLHFWPFVQSLSTAQFTHWWRPMLQKGALGLSALHSASALQPGAHSCVARQ